MKSICLLFLLIVGVWAFAENPETVGKTSLEPVKIEKISVETSRVDSEVFAVPLRLNYQGYLTDDNGNAIDDTATMVFRIYTASAGGSELWSSGSQLLTVEEGVFHYILASVPMSVFDTDQQRWLELTVRGQVLSPRTEITSVAWAYISTLADSAGGAIRIGGQDLTALDARYINNGENAGNDLSGTYPNPTVVRIQTRPISSTAPSSGQVLKWNGSQWAPANDTVGGADADWIISGNDMYSGVSGNVGIGTTNPQTKFHVNGVICGGVGDTVNAVYGAVLGGYSNLVGDAAVDTGAVICGGCDNVALAAYGTVSGGKSNTASSSYTTIGGGRYNNVSFTDATISGGSSNTASSINATVSGGYANTASAASTTVSGGYQNTANGIYATVGGGADNLASNYDATVAGGRENTASGYYSTVAGGYADTSAAWYSFTVGNHSVVTVTHSNSAAFNGQTTTTSGQTRVGILSKASGTFTIDHPLDPMNKILNHYFVESPEMVLIYRGVAVIGTDGSVTVHLPEYYEALNKNPQIQLTGVGTYEVYVAEKVNGNRFVIGGKPGTEVHWVVTGERKDPSAEITKIIMPVEQPKDGELAGRSLDDDFLCSTRGQLERMGKASGFNFRLPANQQRYEDMKRMVTENR